ncbi:molybdenum cofactor guanylyltransferase [bacterium]|nr:molybdenum cofactor guanylyltransferase [bacterium]
MEYSIAIQAGGKSTRMGHDKGLLDFGGTPLVAYIYSQVKDKSKDIFIISNTPDQYKQFGLPVHEDVYKDIGALGGVHTVLSYTQTDHALILACDMPFVNPKIVDLLLSYATDYDVVVPRIHPKGFVEPFKAIYSKRCLPFVDAAIKAGERRVISFFDSVRVKYVEREEIFPVDPEFLSFMNVNTPEDLETALKIAGRDH